MTKRITLTESELNNMLEHAAQRGACLALKAVGLEDDEAGHDVQDLRGLIGSWRLIKKTAVVTAARTGTIFIISLLCLGFAAMAKAHKVFF